MTDNNKFDVSVVVLTYNSEWGKLLKTLNSIIYQEDINFEIVIADDGSEKSRSADARDYYHKIGFDKIKITEDTENVGTVNNYLRALNLCEGKYVKAISPGDYFFDKYSLSKWVGYMEDNSSTVSFCDAVYYNMKNSVVNVVINCSHPFHLSVYKEMKRSKLVFNYLIMNDTILGAALLMRKDILEKYLRRISNRVKFCEDYMLRIAVFDGIKIDYYSQNGIWYEYGDGISTAGNARWNSLIKKDFDTTEDIISESSFIYDRYARHYYSFIKRRKGFSLINKIRKCVYYPEIICERLFSKGNKDITPVTDDFSFIELISQNVDKV